MHTPVAFILLLLQSHVDSVYQNGFPAVAMVTD